MARYKEYGYDIQDGKAIIPEWETEIKEEAFMGCKELTSVEFPLWIKKIGKQAFFGCENLTEITLPEWVEEIGESAFHRCKNLKSIFLPRWVKKIGDRAFQQCPHLTSITIPMSVTEIGNVVFCGCSNLMSISVSKDNKVYDSRGDCNAIIHTESSTLIRGGEKTIIPESVSKIGRHAFCGCSSLTNISIPPSVTEIGNDAFNRCDSLNSVHISDIATWCNIKFNGALHSAHHLYLNGEEIRDLVIPPSVTQIGDYAFRGCSSLTSIAVSKDNKVYDSREDSNAIIHTKSNTLIRGCEKTIIPPSVTEIGDRAFYACSSLTSIAIPPSVTKIGACAFDACSCLTSISIPPSVTEIGDYAFRNCSSLTSIAIPPSVTEIKGGIVGGTFSGCSSLTSISIPPSVTEIGGEAFRGCSSLTSILIPPSVTKIGEEVFSYCSNLTSISVSRDNKVYDSREDCNAIIHTESNTLIRGCENTIIPQSVTEIGEYAFRGCSSLTSISIPPSVTEIKGSILGGTSSWCPSLTSITVSKDNKIYDSREDCNAIIHTESNTLIRGCKNTIIPPSVMKIDKDAFRGCSSLRSITIPESVKEIGECAFYGCSSLKSIIVSKENKVYDSREDCNAIIHTESNTLIRGCENTIIPPSVTQIGCRAFDGCSSLTSITIPESVTEIGDETFSGCSSLTSIAIPPSVTEIGKSAFNGCSSLARISVSKDNKVYDSREDCNAIIHTESNTLIRGCENTIIPQSVTEIGNQAFAVCESLMSISIPPSVTKIGKWSFRNCSSLTSISIPPSVTEIGGIVGGTFSGCSSLTSISIPPSVTEIEGWAFRNCSSLTSITIPPSVTEIRGWAFEGCTSLTEIRIPMWCYVHKYAFRNCPNVQIIRY